jgi:hypothetical protein
MCVLTAPPPGLRYDPNMISEKHVPLIGSFNLALNLVSTLVGAVKTKQPTLSIGEHSFSLALLGVIGLFRCQRLWSFFHWYF